MFFEGINGVQHHPTITGKPLLGGEIDFNEVDIQSGRYELLEDAFESDLRHLVTVQYHERLLDLDFLCHLTTPNAHNGEHKIQGFGQLKKVCGGFWGDY